MIKALVEQVLASFGHVYWRFVHSQGQWNFQERKLKRHAFLWMESVTQALIRNVFLRQFLG